MSPVVGPLFAAALLLAVAGGAKVLRPAATQVALRTAGLPSARPVARLLGAVEVAMAAATFVVGGRLGAGCIAGAYLGFAGFSALLIRRSRGQASCGCFGGSDAPVTRLHVVINLLIAAVAVACLVDPSPGYWSVARDTAAAGVPFAAFTVILAWLLQVALTVLPAVEAAARRGPAAAPAATPSLSIGTKPEVRS